MDALSELLRAVKLSGAMFFDAECVAPWCVRSPPSRSFCHLVAPQSSHVIEFHLIAEGRAWIRVGQETTALSAGDIIMIPHGDEHYLGNGVGGATIDGESGMAEFLSGALRCSRLGEGDGERTRLICGYLACDAQLLQPVLTGLPHVMRVHIRTDDYGHLIESMIRQAVQQAASATPGSGVIVSRLAEVLFAETLRRYLLTLPPGRTGWLAGAADGIVGRALERMHQRPSHPWTLDSLAQDVGISRSVLTERFSRYLGQSPMAYLTDWRLQLAADLLRSTSRSVLQIAGEIGYESEAAFNRAFKRRFAVPPAAYRRSARSTRDRPAASVLAEQAAPASAVT